MTRIKRREKIFSNRKNKYRMKYRVKPRFYVFVAVLVLAVILFFSFVIKGCERENADNPGSPTNSEAPGTGGGEVQENPETETPDGGKDKTPPVIDLPEKITMIIGSDPLKLFALNANDDSGEKPKIYISGDYDPKASGTYDVVINCEDASGNRTEKHVALTIKDPAEGDADFTFVTETGAKGERTGGLCYIEGTLIVNQTFPLPATYEGGLEGAAAESFYLMTRDSDGMVFYIGSFRSYAEQAELYNNSVDSLGKETADMRTERPGHSELQAGVAVNTIATNMSMANTEGAYWLLHNCHEYGYIIRYPEDAFEYTHMEYRPWHVRYVGRELAEKLYKGDGNWMSLEEYFGIPAEYVIG